MEITQNTTPFLTDLFVAMDKEGRRSCVVVVKATYAVGTDGKCYPAEDQEPLVYADQHYGDPGETSIRRECDFVPVKPRAEVLIDASAMAPGGPPVTSLEVALAGPGLVKRALVTGDRFWIDGAWGVRPSAPLPFKAIPLIWDRTFGGTDLSGEWGLLPRSDLRNPVGRGFHLNRGLSTILGKPLPNIERIDTPMRFWSDKPEPIGFGPIGRNCRPRINFAGTYDQHWIDDTFPCIFSSISASCVHRNRPPMFMETGQPFS